MKTSSGSGAHRPLDGARTLVIGASGFVGRHVLTALAEQGASVRGLSRRGGTLRVGAEEIPVAACDIADRTSVETALRDASPDVVLLLAAHIGNEPVAAYETNVRGSINTLGAVAALPTPARVVVAGSSAQYGSSSMCYDRLPESAPYLPVNHYGVSKTAQALSARVIASETGLEILQTVTFNCVGPGQPSRFAPAAFVRQIVEAEAGLVSPIVRAGNLHSKRDFVDVRDVAAAYLDLAVSGVPGETYNVCTGGTASTAEILEMLAGMTPLDLTVEVEPERLRPDDIERQCGDCTKLKNLTGWTPRYELKSSLSSMLDEWREKVGAARRPTDV